MTPSMSGPTAEHEQASILSVRESISSYSFGVQTQNPNASIIAQLQMRTIYWPFNSGNQTQLLLSIEDMYHCDTYVSHLPPGDLSRRHIKDLHQRHKLYKMTN